jgi:hypothetical protein
VSRYVSVPLQVRRREEITAGLQALNTPHQTAGTDRILLDGSLECAGEPVDIRLAAGIAGACEDFGFVRDPDGAFRMVCGDVDRALVTRNLLVPLQLEIAQQRLAQGSDTTVEHHVEADGTRRVLVRPGRGEA